MTHTPFSKTPSALSGTALGLFLALGLSAPLATPVAAAEVVTLTQTGCQFVEPEGGDKGFQTTKKADCETINAKSGDQRVAESDVIRLKAGEYVFRVTNRNVPYELGFWLREEDYDWRNPLHKVSKISVSGGGLQPGATKDYEVTLKPGEYLYSCPLNTTPNYRLVVSEG